VQCSTASRTAAQKITSVDAPLQKTTGVQREKNRG
jgi:hypothetical protein